MCIYINIEYWPEDSFKIKLNEKTSYETILVDILA